MKATMNPSQSFPMKPATCRTITSLMEELEAVDWYNQRVDACKDEELKDFLFTGKPIAHG
jgi:hypothetical protein